MTYCIYTDKDVSPTTPDHIIPLALGGSNGFCVPCDPIFNSKMGEDVDGPMANDPLIMLPRRDADAKGHSGKSPVPVWKKSLFEGRPSQVKLGKDRIEVWDARAGKTLTDEEVVGKPIQSNLKIGMHTSIRFAAKVTLGGGYFVYGDDIRQAIDCDELRALIAFDPKAERNPKLLNSKIKLLDRFDGEPNTNVEAKICKLICEVSPHSTFIATPHQEAISFHVGVLGVHLGSMIVPAKTTMLPIDGDHDLGHVVQIVEGQVRRCSYRSFLFKYYQDLTGETPPELP